MSGNIMFYTSWVSIVNGYVLFIKLDTNFLKNCSQKHMNILFKKKKFPLSLKRKIPPNTSALECLCKCMYNQTYKC